MTVIAFDRNTLVADGRVTRGMDLMADDEVKIHKVRHPELGELQGAFCGVLAMIAPWITHIEQHGFTVKFDPLGDDEDAQMWQDVEALFVTRKGDCYHVMTNGLYSKIQHPTAIGSGANIAQHYLTTGHNALEAVRAAIKTDLSCGGRILTYDVKTRKFHSYAK